MGSSHLLRSLVDRVVAAAELVRDVWSGQRPLDLSKKK
jgi:hypothetical protein